MEIIKQAFGLDVSMDNFVVRHGTIDTKQDMKISNDETFSNETKGFNKFNKWIQENKISSSIPVWFIMEATGVYYEKLAYFLSKKGYNICVMLPNKTKNYAKTLSTKSKTDSIDSRTLTQFGLERKLDKWETPKPLFKELKSLVRERISMQNFNTQLKNQLHAKQYSFQPSKQTVKRLRSLISNNNKTIKIIEKEIEVLLKSDKKLYEKVQKMETIKGVGLTTIASILAETNGFALIKSRKQLASYAGLDVVLNESGKRKGKAKISKRGNSHLRKSVYMPALSAVRWNKEFKSLYVRILSRNGMKKVALTAVARKILLLVYTLWKSEQPYFANYQFAK